MAWFAHLVPACRLLYTVRLLLVDFRDYIASAVGGSTTVALVGAAELDMGLREPSGHCSAQWYRRRLQAMERYEYACDVMGSSAAALARVGRIGTGLLSHQERCARVLLFQPMPPEDSLTVDSVDSLFYDEIDEDWGSGLSHMFWLRGPPRWHAHLRGAARDLRHPVERLASYEIGLRRPLARLWLADPAVRFRDVVLRWAFASAVWRAQFLADDEWLSEKGGVVSFLPACLACGQPTGSYCDGVDVHCGRALCSACCARFDDVGPCCKSLSWPSDQAL